MVPVDLDWINCVMALLLWTGLIQSKRTRTQFRSSFNLALLAFKLWLESQLQTIASSNHFEATCLLHLPLQVYHCKLWQDQLGNEQPNPNS